MRKRVLYLTLVALLVIATPVMAQSMKVGTFGKPNSVGTAPLEVDSDRNLTIATDAGWISSYERVTEDATLTAADSGKTISLGDEAGIDVNLPSAEVGMSFKFVAESTNSFTVNPDDADTIRYNDIAVGDAVQIGGATYSTLSIFCTQELYWIIDNLIGALIDIN